jgi:hypothetical protein
LFLVGLVESVRKGFITVGRKKGLTYVKYTSPFSGITLILAYRQTET